MVRTRSLGKIFGVISIIGVGLAFVTATHTQAGFEWVPAQKQAAPEQVMTPPMQETAPVAPIIIEPKEPTPAPIEVEPIALERDMAPPPVANMPPLGVQPPQQPEPIIKVIRNAPTESPAPIIAEPVEDKIIWSQEERVVKQPVARTSYTNRKPPIRTVSEVPPARVQTKVIMPDDAPQSALSKTSNAETLNAAEQEPEVVITAQPIINAPKENATYEEAVGFGSNTPLAFALSQVVPAGYAYSFASDVNPGQTVSWNGGKPWNEVVSEMVRPLGLFAKIDGKKILIFKNMVPVSTTNTAAPVLEKHSENEMSTEAVDGPITLTQAETKRLNITNPGEAMSEQPQETMVKIERIAQAQQVQEVADIQPAAGSEDTSPPHYKDMNFWQGEKGGSVKDLFSKWSQEANVDLVWEMKHDLTLTNNIMINDNFQNALKTVLTTAIDEQASPSITLMETPGGKNSATLIIKQQKNS